MDILKTLLEEKAGSFISELTTKAGFTAPQAEKFVHEAGAAAVDSLKSQASALNDTDLASPKAAEAVLGGIDVAALAGKIGIPTALSAQGLKTMVPMLLGLLGAKAGGLGGLLGMLGGAQGGTAGLLGKMMGGAQNSTAKLGGLFGK